MAARGAPPKKVEAWATQYQKAPKGDDAMPDGHEPARSHARWLEPGARARAGSPRPQPRTGGGLARWSGGARREPNPSTSQPRSMARTTAGQPADRRCAARRGGSHGHRERTCVRRL